MKTKEQFVLKLSFTTMAVNLSGGITDIIWLKALFCLNKNMSLTLSLANLLDSKDIRIQTIVSSFS